jgi:hypothetical protein
MQTKHHVLLVKVVVSVFSAAMRMSVAIVVRMRMLALGAMDFDHGYPCAPQVALVATRAGK